MYFDLIDFAVFDIFLFERAGVEATYDAETCRAAEARFQDMTEERTQALSKTVTAGLPGAATTLSIEDLRSELSAYDGIGKDDLKHNLKAFLEAVVPTAEKLGLKMACHPDDPPWPVLGLPRIVSTEADLAWLTGAVDSPSNGLTFCSGSLGAHADNDLNAIVKRFANRIHFFHLRNVRRLSEACPTSFYEDSHLDGSTDMVSLIRDILATHPTPVTVPMRPDHGQDILTDIGRNPALGYPLCGRMKGLAELRGVVRALSHVS